METKESREVIQFHYTTWPDFGVPQSPVAFLEFLKKVRESGALEPNVGPPVVHCSAGIGRSGTFCLVDSCLVLVSFAYANIFTPIITINYYITSYLLAINFEDNKYLQQHITLLEFYCIS